MTDAGSRDRQPPEYHSFEEVSNQQSGVARIVPVAALLAGLFIAVVAYVVAALPLGLALGLGAMVTFAYGWLAHRETNA